jgi:hypothetical protein
LLRLNGYAWPFSVCHPRIADLLRLYVSQSKIQPVMPDEVLATIIFSTTEAGE